MATTKVQSELIVDDVALAGNPTTTTQSAGNNTTRIATTAFVTTAVDNLIASAPGTMDTLNEIAAALGDDPSFTTTVNNAIATKLPLAGGTMTGTLAMGANAITSTGTISSGAITATSNGNDQIHLKGTDTNATAILMDYNGTGSTDRVRIYNNAGGFQFLTENGDEKLSIAKTTGNATFAGTISSGAITSSSHVQAAGALKVTENGTAQVIMIGNQDSGGVNKPAMIMGVNGYLRFGHGDSWSSEGGTFTEIINLQNGHSEFTGQVTINESAAKVLELTRTGSATYDMTISDVGNGAAQLWFNAQTNDTGFNFRPKNSSGTNNNALFIDPDGHCGFGQTAPNTQIHVGTSTTTDSRIQITHENADGFGSLDIDSYGSATLRLISNFSGSTMNGVPNDTFGLVTPHNYSIVLGTSGSERMRVSNTGKIGINNNNPLAMLDIIGSGYEDIRLGSNRTDNTNKLAGITAYMYTNNTVSMFQMFNQNGSNITYYGSADGAHRGVQAHKFYVNTNYNATSGHTKALEIRSDGDVHAAYTGSADTSGYFYAGKDWGATNHRINRAVTQGGGVLVVSGYGGSGIGADTALFFAVASGGRNSAATAMAVEKNGTTLRSINAAGTINASGADYAEYMEKKSTAFEIAAGDICGVNEDGKLTNKFTEAHSFVVKSTDPAYVGGDIWGNEDAVGKRPELTKQGYVNPAEEAPETDAEYEIRRTKYETDLAAFEVQLEAQRIKYDRIAFSGQVPVNITGASVGDYIIPIKKTNNLITAEAVSSPSFEQYQIAVGKVWKIQEDGRAFISVKIG